MVARTRLALVIAAIAFASVAWGQSLEHARGLAKSADVKDRLAAVAEFRSIVSAEAFAALVELFKDTDRGVRLAAVEAFPIALDAYDDPILAQMQASKDEARNAELERLRAPVWKYAPFLHMRDNLVPALDVLIRQDPKPTRELMVKMAAAIDVNDTPFRDDEEIIGRCGTGFNFSAQATFHYAIERRPDVALAMLDDPQVGIKTGLIYGLALAGNLQALPKIERFTLSSNNALRAAAVRALASYPSDRTFTQVTEMAGDRAVLVRCGVCTTLQSLGAKRAMPLMIEMLGDPSPSVSFSASRVLKDIQDNRIVARLLELIPRTEDGFSRFAEAMIEHPSTLYIPMLVKLIDTPKGDDRERAVRTLAAIPGQSAKKLILKLTRDADADIRKEAAWGLKAWNEPQVWETLIDMLRDKDESVVMAACNSLGDLKVTSALAALRKVKSDDHYVKEAVAEAIEKIAGTTDPP